MKSGTFSRTSPERTWEPSATTTGSKSWIFLGGLFKIEGRSFSVGVPPGAVLEAKMEPKLSQNRLPNYQKRTSKISPNFDCKSVENMSQNDSQTDPKWHQNCIKFQTCFRTDFLRVSCSRRPGHLGGRRVLTLPSGR